MKKLLYALTILLVSIQAASAQEIKKINSIGANFITERTSLVWTKEYGLNGLPITVGSRFIGYYNSDYKVLSLLIGPTANYHFSEHLDVDHDKIDLYAGATIGAHLSFLLEKTNSYADTFHYNTVPFIQLGGRYFLSDKIGVYAQGNFDLGNRINTGFGSSFEVGISFRKK